MRQQSYVILADMDSVADFAAGLAYKVGEFLHQNFKTDGTPAYLKADRSAVTEIDLAADRLVTDEIHRNFPTDGLLSEELQPVHKSGYSATWVVDPLDGTTNYSLGLPIWGVSIARLVDGIPEIAAVHFPPLNEMYTVQRGQGAFMNGVQMQVKPPRKDEPFTFFSCCSRTHRMYTVQVPYKARILGSAAYSFCSLARGISLLSFEATAKVWDVAGAWLVVDEAGGLIETLDGSQPFPLTPGIDYTAKEFPVLAASTPALAARARQQILPKE